MTLADFLDENGIENVDLLKMDIEGSEFEVLLTAEIETLRRIRRVGAGISRTARSGIEGGPRSALGRGRLPQDLRHWTRPSIGVGALRKAVSPRRAASTSLFGCALAHRSPMRKLGLFYGRTSPTLTHGAGADVAHAPQRAASTLVLLRGRVKPRINDLREFS